MESIVLCTGIDTYTVEVLPTDCFPTLISYWICYSENYWLAQNFPYTRPSRSLSWLPNLCPTKLKLCLSDWTYNMMKKVDHKVRYRRETAPVKESVLTKTIRRHEQVLQTYPRLYLLRGELEIDTQRKAFHCHPWQKDQYHSVLVSIIRRVLTKSINRQEQLRQTYSWLYSSRGLFKIDTLL